MSLKAPMGARCVALLILVASAFLAGVGTSASVEFVGQAPPPQSSLSLWYRQPGQTIR
jgi:hypothetical protein